MAESYTIPNIDSDFSCMEASSSLSLTSRNLQLPVHCVSVEYLPDHQKLKIPAALEMSWTPTSQSLCQTHPTLYSRFWKVASMTYTEIKSLVKTINKTTVETIREVIDGREMMTPSSERPTWETPEADSDETFSNLSKVLQFNCDVRDFGHLLSENATVTDSAWCNNVESVSSARLHNKLKPYTLLMLAALNLESVGGYHYLGAWVRAYGLGVGIYPARGSAFKTEAVCTNKLPSTDDEADVLFFQQSFKEPLENLCLNILAVFGLLHLSKDKTYVKGDEYMSRICNSYKETLNTPGTNHKDCILRIAPHPFGIAQTYWLAKSIMVINEAAREWENLPEAREVLVMFSDNLSRLNTQEVAIKEAPPNNDINKYLEVM